MTQNVSHQRRIFDPDEARPVTVIGAGSVGSQLVRMLACVGANDITVYDHDFVASHNIPMSEYRQKDLARHKVEALAEIVLEKSGVAIKVKRRAYKGEPLRGSVVSCVDTMEARMCIWKAIKNDVMVDAFVDTRIDEVTTCVFALRPTEPEDIAYYEHFLYPSKEVKTPSCGEHNIMFVSAQAAADACRQLTLAWSTGSMVRHMYRGYGDKPYLDIPGS